MNTTQNLEVRVYGGVLAVLAIAGSWVMLRQSDRFGLLLAFGDSLEGWLALGMLTAGLLQLVGAVVPLRKIRQLGFVLTSLGWFVVLGVFLMHLLVSLMTFVVALLGAANLWCHIKDVRGKPRAECGCG